MSAVQTIAASPRLRTESLRGALLWLTGFSGAFVFIEPSPYEFVATIAGLLFLLLECRCALPWRRFSCCSCS
jgi:hypothetical protein